MTFSGHFIFLDSCKIQFHLLHWLFFQWYVVKLLCNWSKKLWNKDGNILFFFGFNKSMVNTANPRHLTLWTWWCNTKLFNVGKLHVNGPSINYFCDIDNEMVWHFAKSWWIYKSRLYTDFLPINICGLIMPNKRIIFTSHEATSFQEKICSCRI